MKKSHRASPASPLRILLTDDNQHGLAARRSVLEEAGYLVTACSDPHCALEEFRNSTFDLLVTDYRMPGMNGVELIRRIRDLKPDVPVILVSGVVEVLGLNERNTGADVVIAKSATEISHLVRAVNKLLRPTTAKKPVRSQSRGRIAKSV